MVDNDKTMKDHHASPSLTEDQLFRWKRYHESQRPVATNHRKTITTIKKSSPSTPFREDDE